MLCQVASLAVKEVHVKHYWRQHLPSLRNTFLAVGTNDLGVICTPAMSESVRFGGPSRGGLPFTSGLLPLGMKRNALSPRYTTEWAGLPVGKAC